MLAYIADEQHAIVGTETVQEGMQLLGGVAACTSAVRAQALIVSAPAARSTAAYSASVSRALTNFVRELDMGLPPFRSCASPPRRDAAMTHGVSRLTSRLPRSSLGGNLPRRVHAKLQRHHALTARGAADTKTG
jgi:hypothetical protein